MDPLREVKKSISPFMKARGFICSGRNYYYKSNDMVFSITLSMPSGLVYVTASIMPLYIPCKSKYYTYGNRLSSISDINLPLINAIDKETPIDEWCKSLCFSIDQKVIPFFEKVASPGLLINFVEEFQYSPTSYIACHEVYIWRLKMFTYLYMGAADAVKETIINYRNTLKSVTFFTSQVRKELLEEIDKIETFIPDHIDKAETFCSQIIHNTQQYI